ncbi:solute carrier organic anion transporter family member 4A1-like isoform X3 [Mytilus trossulus]
MDNQSIENNLPWKHESKTNGSNNNQNNSSTNWNSYSADKNSKTIFNINGNEEKATLDFYKSDEKKLIPDLKGSDVKPDIDKEWEEQNLRYGWFNYKPRWAQVFNSIRWFVFWTCVFSLVQGFIVNGVINAVISTLEKRYELPSSKSGLIASSNDFFAFFLVLAISYYGGKRNKPKLIGIGILTLGIGSIVFSLPQFLAGEYNFGSTDLNQFENVCRNTTESCEGSQEKKSHLQKYLYVFMLGNALHGAGSTPMFTLGTTFIDENTKAEMTSLYLGLIYAAASIGVAAGYMGGGQTLWLFTDFYRTDPSEISITPADPRWVGAWWISFLASGAIMFIVAIPMIAYPKQLPGSAAIQAKRKSEAYQGKQAKKVKDDNFGKSWKDFPIAMWNLVLNPTFLFMSLGACTDGAIISGVATFGPKFFAEKFNLPPAFAGLIMGCVTVPGAGGGMFVGGYVVKKKKLKCRSIIRFNLALSCIALFFGCLFLIECPTQRISGVTIEYKTHINRDAEHNLGATCNADCGCSAMVYEPVCGLDGSQYFSPCHAGCSSKHSFIKSPMGPIKMYLDCDCVEESITYKMNNSMNKQLEQTDAMRTTTMPSIDFSKTTNYLSSNSSNMTGPRGPPMGAYQGICMTDCILMYVVAPLLFIGMFLTFSTVSPCQTATMRCVPQSERALAIGFQWLLLRLLGTTPGPVMLGAIIDSACKVWQNICGETGNCWIYQKTDMGIKIFIWWCLMKGLAVLFYFLAQYFYKAPPEDNDTEGAEKLMHPVEKLETRESVL